MSLFSNTYYYDNFGNPIKEEHDILVTNQDRLDQGEYFSIKENGLVGRGKRFSHFYSVYVHPATEEQFDIICSRVTREVIPFECLNKPTYTILLCGINGASKTTSAVQYFCECPDLISGAGGISLRSALDARKLPEHFRDNVLRYYQRLEMQPTPDSLTDGCESILFYVKGADEDAAIKLLDVPGEVPLNGASASFDHCDAVFLYVDLSVPDKDEERILFQRQVDRITDLLTQPNIADSIPVYVILTKADKLNFIRDGVSQNLSQIIPASTTYNSYGKLQLKPEYHVANGGYDHELYRQYEAEITDYMKGIYPAIYYSLEKGFGSNLRFFITGNYMQEILGSSIPEDAYMYRVEQPLLHFLVENNLFPEKQEGGPGRDFGGFVRFRSFLKKVME